MVVDVLSFTTTLSVAADLEIEVLPYRWNNDSAPRYAATYHAVLASGRSQVKSGAANLSPNTILKARGAAVGSALSEQVVDRIHARYRVHRLR